MTASIPFHWWFMNNLAGQSVCLGPHTTAQPRSRDELMNSELDGVKLGMTWWSVPVIHLVAKLEIDDFIGLWLSAAVSITMEEPQVSLLPREFVCWHAFFYLHVNVCLSVSSVSSLTHTAQSLEKEVQEVKATLQSMLAQLKEEEEEEEEAGELQDDDLMKNGTEEELEEEEEE